MPRNEDVEIESLEAQAFRALFLEITNYLTKVEIDTLESTGEQQGIKNLKLKLKSLIKNLNTGTI